jgi:hypothetical protein
VTTPLDRTIPATVRALIARFGVSATLRTHESDPYVAATRKTSGAHTETPVTATPPVPLSFSIDVPNSHPRVAAETWISASGLGVTPKPSDEIVFATANESFVVAEVEAYYSGDVLAAYRLVGGR